MPGWTYTSGPSGVGSVNSSDDGEKAGLFPVPPGTGVQWMPQLIWDIRQMIAARLQLQGGVNSLAFSANNGPGDTGGLGTFTITFTTS